jgi:hypothetical protein
LWTPKLKKRTQLLAANANCFQWLPHFFSSLNILPITFIFSSACCLLINTWFSKLIQPFTTSLCVLYAATWKHLTSSLWMNIANFILQLLHICNVFTLSVLTPLHLPYTPYVDCAHLCADCENTSSDYIDFSADYAHNSNDCVNALDD